MNGDKTRGVEPTGHTSRGNKTWTKQFIKKYSLMFESSFWIACGFTWLVVFFPFLLAAQMTVNPLFIPMPVSQFQYLESCYGNSLSHKFTRYASKFEAIGGHWMQSFYIIPLHHRANPPNHPRYHFDLFDVIFSRTSDITEVQGKNVPLYICWGQDTPIRSHELWAHKPKILS